MISKKSDVGKYFKTVQGTVEGIKSGLNKIVAEMKAEKNPNAEATESAVKTLVESKLDKIIEGAKIVSETIGSDATAPIGNVANAKVAGAIGIGIDNLVKGIRAIVDVVLGDKGNAEAGDAKKAETLANRAANDGAGKLFGNSGDQGAIDSTDNAKKAAADAAKAVGAVIGADILQSIVKKDGDAVKLATNSPIANTAVNAPKDGTVAGAIALRAMAKGGKFANGENADDAKKAVEDAAISAVTKALDTLTIAIRDTIDAGLKAVKEAMKITTNDIPVASENSGSGGQNK